MFRCPMLQEVDKGLQPLLLNCSSTPNPHFSRSTETDSRSTETDKGLQPLLLGCRMQMSCAESLLQLL